MLLWGTRGAADARRIAWDGFLEPVKRICLVQVVAAKEHLEALDQLRDIELAADSDEAEARPRHEVEP